MSASASITIRPWRPGDEVAITRLFGEVFGHPLSVEQWRWKYQGRGPDAFVACVAEDASGELLGHAGAMRLRGMREGRALDFYQACDVMVAEAARGEIGSRNLFFRLASAVAAEIRRRSPDAFYYGFAGRRPLLAGERMKVYERLFEAVEYERPARMRFGLVRARPLAWNDARIDALWARHAGDFPLSLMRDRAYLQWRYAENPIRRYDLVGFTRFGRLLGWGVLTADRERQTLVDMLLPPRFAPAALIAVDRVAAARGVAGTRLWWPSSWPVPKAAATPSGIHPTHIVPGTPYATATIREGLYLSMGDADIY